MLTGKCKTRASRPHSFHQNFLDCNLSQELQELQELQVLDFCFNFFHVANFKRIFLRGVFPEYEIARGTHIRKKPDAGSFALTRSVARLDQLLRGSSAGLVRFRFSSFFKKKRMPFHSLLNVGFHGSRCTREAMGAKIFGKFFEQPPSVLCRFRGILEITLPAGPAAEPTYFISPRSSGNWRPLGRGPTGRTPHC